MKRDAGDVYDEPDVTKLGTTGALRRGRGGFCDYDNDKYKDYSGNEINKDMK
jgi:hypothetical protein